MIYNYFEINILDSNRKNIFDNSKKFISFEVIYQLNSFPQLVLKLYSLKRLDLSFTDFIIKINMKDYFYEFKMGIIESKFLGKGVYEFTGINLPYKHLQENRSRYLSTSLKTSFEIIGTPYFLNIKSDLKSNFYQTNESDLSILTYLLSGISEGVPLVISDKYIQLMNVSKKETILNAEKMGNIVIRNKFIVNNVVVRKLKDHMFYQGLDENIFIKKSSQSEFYKNRLINRQFMEGLTRISLLLHYDTVSPNKNVGDKVIVEGAYSSNIIYTVISKKEVFTESGISTDLIVGASEL
jgi:hypothetical protein